MAKHTHNLEKLKTHILGLSNSQDWETAKHEWTIDRICSQPKHKIACTCGHKWIQEVCYIRNKHNGTLTYVGNVCVEHFTEGMVAQVKAYESEKRKAQKQREELIASQFTSVGRKERAIIRAVLDAMNLDEPIERACSIAATMHGVAFKDIYKTALAVYNN